LVEYVDRKEDSLIQVVIAHKHNTDTAVLQRARSLKTEEQKEIKKMKDSLADKTNGRRHFKRTHEEFARKFDEKLVDFEQSYRRKLSGDTKGETERTVVAAQDEAEEQTKLRIKF